MIFNLKNEEENEKAEWYFDFLSSKMETIEIIKKRKNRSYSQNSYLHLILSYFGNHFGYTAREAKQEIFKKHVNTDLFYDGEKDGIISIISWRSTADLNTQEMSIAIDKFMKFSAENGLELPEASNTPFIQEIENNMSSNENKKYI